MQLKLTITGKRGERLGANSTRTFGEAGGTIGRSGSNDWVLPDEKRYLSGMHATISFRLGRFYVTDHSMNGVFVNGSTIPVGDTAPHRLFEGDRLRMGYYRMQVDIVESTAEATPDETYPMSRGGNRVEEPLSAELALDMLDEDAIAEQMDMAALLDDNLDVGNEIDELTDSMLHAAIGPSALGSHTAKILELPPGHADRHRRDGEAGSRGQDAVFASLLKGLRLEPDMLADHDPAALAFAAGLALREFMQGSSQMAQHRAQISQAFQLGEPPVQSIENLSVPEMVVDLLTGAGQEFADPAENVRALCERHDRHQMALLFAMREAFVDFTEQLKPSAVRASTEAANATKSWRSGNRKAQYYEQFREIFHELMKRQQGDLPAGFREQFSAAYRRHTAQLAEPGNPQSAQQAATPE
jgi:type VI secretion system FHA domain protein